MAREKKQLDARQVRVWRKHQKKLYRKKARRMLRHILLCLVTIVLLAAGGLYALMAVIFYGPSETAGDTLTQTCLETSALKFIPRIYYSQEHVDEIVARNGVIEPDMPVDTSLIVIDKKEIEKEEKPIELVELSGATYRGWMLIVKDPSRVSVAVSSPDGFTSDKKGLTVAQIAENYGAVAAINASGFEDSGGTGNGGMPLGLVITQGRRLHGATPKSKDTAVVAGFDANDKLIVAKMTNDQAKTLGIRDAVAFGPALVVNGVASQVSGVSSGLNPRTAIGQRADGAVLLLVIDGRQTTSLGASIADLIEIMVKYGAVNAMNLDGGSSTIMLYEGKQINAGAPLTGGRKVPTAIIVK